MDAQTRLMMSSWRVHYVRLTTVASRDFRSLYDKKILCLEIHSENHFASLPLAKAMGPRLDALLMDARQGWI